MGNFGDSHGNVVEIPLGFLAANLNILPCIFGTARSKPEFLNRSARSILFYFFI
ncbi:MAG: hypothetical protein Sylvanvirus22_11 [Sylvanvirus sp.]|uniref:Uncharacterized protein n=1 Tax=Sylvanvirus sp. TaxID=2487774 RepID=A0A3G5AIN4_9VIRU|nr:MAG: hypothetical protein Sylvanvirus22_11 [Sylvanvirus sp.]